MSEARGTQVPAEPVFDTVEDWVLDHFLPIYRRTLGGEFRWCAWWWEHAEAVSRLTALWRSWEVAHAEDTDTSLITWYRDCLDQQLPLLLGARGPFYQCSEEQHNEPRQARAILAPPGSWRGSETAGER